jgi:filamin
MHQQEERWVETQHTTFRSWSNHILSKYHQRNNSEFIEMNDLRTGLQNGINLVYMMRELTRLPIPVIQNATLKIQYIQNVNYALSSYQQFHDEKIPDIKLVNINAEAIVDGNLKLILGMIWTMIHRFQLSQYSESGSNIRTNQQNGYDVELLNWVNTELSASDHAPVGNFTTDFQDGTVLFSLADIFAYAFNLDHNLLKQYLSSTNTMNNDAVNLQRVKNALQISHDLFSVPYLMSAEDIAYHPDKLSMMTYLSTMRSHIIDFAFDMEMKDGRFTQNETIVQQQTATQPVNTTKKIVLPPPPPLHLVQQKMQERKDNTNHQTGLTKKQKSSRLYTVQVMLNHYSNKLSK